MNLSKIADNLNKMLTFTSKVVFFDEDESITGSYPGEYMDNVRQRLNIYDNMHVVEELAYVLAKHKADWNDDDTTVFNSDQRIRIYRWLETIENKTAVINASLSVLYAVEQTLERPLKNPEVCTRLRVEALQEITKKISIQDLIFILDLLPELANKFENEIKHYLIKSDVYIHAEEIHELLLISQNKAWSLKNSIITSMKKMLTQRIIEDTTPYKKLSAYFTDRQIQFMNLFFINAKQGIKDKVIICFFESILFGNTEQQLSAQEEALLNRYVQHNFVRKIENFKNLLMYLFDKKWKNLQKSYCLKNNHDWDILYKLLQPHLPQIAIGDNQLSFNPLEEDNAFKWEKVSDSEKVKIISFYVKVKDTLAEYKEEEITKYKAFYDLASQAWQTEFVFDMLNQNQAFNVITAFIQLGYIEMPQIETDWLKQLIGMYSPKIPTYAINYVVQFCESSKTYPYWLYIRSVNDVETILRQVPVECCSEDVLFKYFGLIMECLWQQAPELWLTTILNLFTVDVDYSIAKFVPESDLKLLANYLIKEHVTNDRNGLVRKHLMTPSEYAAWEEETARKAFMVTEMQKLLEYQQNMVSAMNYLLSQNCDTDAYRKAFRPDTHGFRNDILYGIAIKKFEEDFESQSWNPIIATKTALSICTNLKKEDMLYRLLKMIIEKGEF